MRRLKVDWEELEDAFQDDSNDHRYYLDRETGVVMFFSSYLDNEEEEEDERRVTSEDRYVSIPLALRMVPRQELSDFVNQLSRQERKILGSTLLEGPAFDRFSSAIEALPRTREKWKRFYEGVVRRRVRRWLTEVGVEPLSE